MTDLLSHLDQQRVIQIHSGAFYLPQALTDDKPLIDGLRTVLQHHQTHCLMTPTGLMSSALTSCGDVGWHSDSQGARYCTHSPFTQTAWPPIPHAFLHSAYELAAACGYPNFKPNTCLINRYKPSARMGLHNDNSEYDSSQPVVSLSFGLSAKFHFGGSLRHHPYTVITLHHGDAVVWGGSARHAYHGIAHIIDGNHPTVGRQRINVTLRYVDLSAINQPASHTKRQP